MIQPINHLIGELLSDRRYSLGINKEHANSKQINEDYKDRAS